MATTNDLKNGLVLNLDGQLWTVVEFQHVKPGKGGAFVRTKLKNVLSGKVVDKTFNAGTKVETATVDKRAMTYLYKDGADFVFMDGDTYDQIHVPAETVGDGANYLLENAEAIVAVHEGDAALRRAADQRRARRSATPSRACRATAPPAAPSRPRWRPATRSRSRCSSHRREGQGRHPRRPVPRPGQLSLTQWLPARKARKRASTSSTRPSCGASTALSTARRPRRARPSRRSPEYTVELVEGVPTHRDRIDELIADVRGGLDARPDARRRPRDAAARRLRAAVARRRAATPWSIDEAVELAKTLSTDESPAFVNGLLAIGRPSPIHARPWRWR